MLVRGFNTRKSVLEDGHGLGTAEYLLILLSVVAFGIRSPTMDTMFVNMSKTGMGFELVPR